MDRGGSEDVTLLVRTSVFLTYEFAGATPSATSMISARMFAPIVHPSTLRFQQHGRDLDHVERPINEWQVDDSHEGLMIDGVTGRRAGMYNDSLIGVKLAHPKV